MALSTVNNFFNAKKVSISTFEKICEALGLDKRAIQRPLAFEQEVEVKEKLEFSLQFSKYNAQTWVGRERLIEDFLTKLSGNTRIFWLTGLSGIGKTTLGECIAVKAWENNPSFRWIHFEITESQLSDFATGARAILSKLGEKDLNSETINDPKWLSDRLLTKLQENRYWLQIDALEKLIEINEFIDENWLIFFKSCLTANSFSSRLFLTSQVLPNAMMIWQDDYSNVWYEHKLKGLDAEESEQYFIKSGILVNKSNQNFLNNISQIYEGHPLVLQVITKEIVKDYQGDVAKYWEHNKAEFDQVRRELNSNHLMGIQYNEALDRRVRERVKKSLEQLPKIAIALLCRSSVYRRQVREKFWLDLMTEYSTREQIEAYRILGDRALIEKEKNLIRLHNLVRDIAYDWLREDEVIWKAAEVKAAELWLSEHQYEENAENLEKIRGYLEAFYHYCYAENWEKAKQIIQIRLEVTNNKELHDQLFIWAYYDQIINIFNLLLDKSDTRINIIGHKVFAQVYDTRENYQQAIYHHQQGLIMAKRTNDISSQLVLYNGFSNTLARKNPQNAIQILNTAIQENRDPILQAVMYCNLGTAYFRFNKIQEAIHNYQISLDIAQEINYEQGMANVYSNAALISASLNRFRDAEMYFRKALPVFQVSENYFEINNFKEAFGMVLCRQYKYLEGIKLLEEALKGFGKIGFLKRNMELLFKLSFAYYNIKQIELAREYYKKAQQVSIELGISLPQGYQELLSQIEEAESC
ncbi:MAG: tetratricopeptide repeat protein [Snowella sp.]|nr:tetratricopeptide repeat protein [Snowella sp.]